MGEQEQSMDVKARTKKTHSRALIQWLIRLCLIGLLIYWLQTDVAHSAFEKLSKISVSALFGMACISIALMVISAYRWLSLIRAFGNPDQPISLLLKLSLVGHFYNTFVPGAVGGDVLRAAVTSDFYAKNKTSYLVVFMERFLGLSCVCVILGFGLLAQEETYSVLANTIGIVGLIAFGGLGIILLKWQTLLGFAAPYLDAVTDTSKVVHALGLSLLGQATTLLLFAFICRQFDIELTVAQYCFIFPLGLLASILPVSVLGAGARELALISLLVTRGGVSDIDAVGVSTAYLGCLWFLGVLGGVIHLLTGGLKPNSVGSDTTQSSE